VQIHTPSQYNAQYLVNQSGNILHVNRCEGVCICTLLMCKNARAMHVNLRVTPVYTNVQSHVKVRQ